MGTLKFLSALCLIEASSLKPGFIKANAQAIQRATRERKNPAFGLVSKSLRLCRDSRRSTFSASTESSEASGLTLLRTRESASAHVPGFFSSPASSPLPVPSAVLSPVQVLHYTVNMLKAADLLKVSSYDLDLRIHHPCRSTNFGWIPPRCAMLQAPPLPMRSLELKNSTPVADIRKLRLITAIKTPYLPDGRFDLEAYDKLVHSQIENGVEGVIVGGTTGEGQLMGWDEHIMLIGHTVNCFGGVIKVIGNTGSNSTGEAMHATEQGFAVGMHAALHINPYYGKTSQEGLLLHFQSVLSMGPSVIYNVPTRTGQDIPPSVIVKLMDIPNFAGVKECVGNDRIKGYTERNIAVWSGNDDQCHDARWDFGARGVISVVSNLIPGLMRDLIIKGKDKGLNEKLLPLINWLFVEPNPIGLNTALVQLGIVRPVFRLPYVPLDIKKRQEFVELVNSIGGSILLATEMCSF
ncbi:hypothetical protein L7F22_016067 [Adiantum nelumboides]|nr:hypothetical protein [Adiantum nelumboides]